MRLELDPATVTAELLEAEVEARANAEALFEEHRFVTRLRSSMSPEEMTVDPRFGFNPDLPRPTDITQLDVTVMCSDADPDWWEAPLHLAYPVGLGLTIPGFDELNRLGMTEFEYVQCQIDTTALLIEQLGESGEGQIIVDNRPEYTDGGPLDPVGGTDGLAADDASEGAAGCGCNAGGSAAIGGLPLVLLAVLGRRRRRVTAQP